MARTERHRGRKRNRVGFRRLVFASLTVLLFGPGCFLPPRPDYDDALTATTPPDLPPMPAEPALGVLVIGDFGTGESGQAEVARAIAETHASAPPDLVLTVGDNFYPRGVASVEDPLWASVFEDVYTGDFWNGLVFHPSLGNHDVQGNEQAQILYSQRSPRWALPARYHTFRKALPTGDSIRFIALDTNLLEEGGAEARTELEWVDSILGASRDSWVIPYGHHPLRTGGWHGTSDAVYDDLSPRLTGRVPLFMSGHNHSTELLELPEGFLQAVCGGGAGRDNAYRVDTTPQTLSAFSNGGWCFLRILPDTLAVELYNRVGTLLFRHLIVRPS